MKTLNFKKTVDPNGSIFLSDLPPNMEVEVAIAEVVSAEKTLAALRREFRKKSPLVNMSREEVLAHLRKTREQIFDESNQDMP